MKPELINAFSTARYEILDPQIEFKIGEISSGINQLLEEYECRSWAFVTPFNPGSQVVPNEENELRLQALRKAVRKYVTIEGRGGGQDEQSPLEKSLFILGISLPNAKRIGKRFGQDAIVFGYINIPAQLIILNSRHHP